MGVVVANLRDFKAMYVLKSKIESFLHDSKLTDDMDIGYVMYDPYPNSNTVTVFIWDLLDILGERYITTIAKLDVFIKPTVDNYMIKDGTCLENMRLWTKEFKPAIKKLTKAGEKNLILFTVFNGSQSKMDYFLSNYDRS